MTAPDKPEGLIAGGEQVESEVAKLIWSTLTDTDFSVIQRQDMVNAHPAMVAVRAILSSPRVEEMRETLIKAAMNAQLPDNYQWGEDAMEAFNFGKTCAANAVEAALATERKE